MTAKLPTVTVIIPARPGQREISAVTAAQALHYPAELLEIMVARGCQPAVQRNAAIRQARGEVIYFLDDDAQPEPDNLQRAVPRFADAGVQMVGGPNLCPPDAPGLEKVFAIVLASWLAFGPSRARYDRIGTSRQTSEKELILCNLLARRQSVLAAGGFDEALYPNEENALMDALQKDGGKLLYDPEVAVLRRPRSTLGAFSKMVFRYGRGRAEQFRLHPTPGSALNFVPPLFCLYLLVAPWLGWIGGIPLFFYGAAIGVETLLLLRRHGWRSVLAAPLIVLTHLCYGVGFWRGLSTQVGPRAATRPALEVSLETVNART